MVKRLPRRRLRTTSAPLDGATEGLGEGFISCSERSFPRDWLVNLLRGAEMAGQGLSEAAAEHLDDELPEGSRGPPHSRKVDAPLTRGGQDSADKTTNADRRALIESCLSCEPGDRLMSVSRAPDLPVIDDFRTNEALSVGSETAGWVEQIRETSLCPSRWGSC